MGDLISNELRYTDLEIREHINYLTRFMTDLAKCIDTIQCCIMFQIMCLQMKTLRSYLPLLSSMYKLWHSFRILSLGVVIVDSSGFATVRGFLQPDILDVGLD